jgi:inner membrane protease ATP23
LSFSAKGLTNTHTALMTDSTPQSPTATPTTSPSDDATYYTWSSFFSILSGHATPTERAAYFRTKDILHEETDILRAEADKKWLFANSPIVRFLAHNISLLGPTNGSASITPERVTCRKCDDKQGGGFDPEYGILICANQMRNRSHMEDTLAHEMVHAYDHLRFKMDAVHNLRHAACTEIRASTLSGECRWGREFFTRGQWGVTQQLQECVRRRAALSVAARPGCRDAKHAEQVVNEVWDSCFHDTRPFDEIYK